MKQVISQRPENGVDMVFYGMLTRMLFQLLFQYRFSTSLHSADSSPLAAYQRQRPEVVMQSYPTSPSMLLALLEARSLTQAACQPVCVAVVTDASRTPPTERADGESLNSFGLLSSPAEAAKKKSLEFEFDAG